MVVLHARGFIDFSVIQKCEMWKISEKREISAVMFLYIAHRFHLVA